MWKAVEGWKGAEGARAHIHVALAPDPWVTIVELVRRPRGVLARVPLLHLIVRERVELPRAELRRRRETRHREAPAEQGAEVGGTSRGSALTSFIPLSCITIRRLLVLLARSPSGWCSPIATSSDGAHKTSAVCAYRRSVPVRIIAGAGGLSPTLRSSDASRLRTNRLQARAYSTPAIES